MKAWTVKQPGGIEMLEMVEREIPSAKQGELLIEVKAAGVNRLDIINRENQKMEPPYPILGVEVSGIVKENNTTNESLKPGTKVAGLVADGGYSEYAVIPEGRVIILPDSIDMTQGAAIPEVFLTAYQTMYWIGDLKKSETILIHAGASGVGTAAIQMARQISNAKIIVTAGSQEKLDFCKKIGADVTINYKEKDFSEVIQKETNNRGVDVILDFIGASYWEKNIKSAAVDARWVLIGTLGGSEIENVSLGSLLQKRITLSATLLSPRSDEYKAELTKDFQEKVLPYFENGKIKSIIYEVAEFGDLPVVHEKMEDNKNIGKFILVTNDKN